MNDKVFINRGIINFNELIKNNYSYDKLITSLHKKGIASPSLVDYCVKRNNELLIFSKNGINNYPISLIIDGTILKDNLFSINKTYKWLSEQIKDHNLEINNINYAYYKNKHLHFITN